jgi:hypothetical protein
VTTSKAQAHRPQLPAAIRLIPGIPFVRMTRHGPRTAPHI